MPESRARGRSRVDAPPDGDQLEADASRRGDEGEPGDETGATVAERASTGEPDVLLHVPVVKVDEINFEVDELKARVALHAAVGDLVSLDVGADVSIGRVKLEIKGVEAQALLKVRLNNVYAILARTLATVERNPELLEAVLKPLGETVGAVGRTAERAVPEVAGAVGRTAERAVHKVTSAVGRTALSSVPGVGAAVKQSSQSAAPGAQDPARDMEHGGSSARSRQSAPPRPSPPSTPSGVTGSNEPEVIALFDGSEVSFGRWRHVGGGTVAYDDGALHLKAGDELGLFYFSLRGFDDFRVRVQYRPEQGAQVGLAVRFARPPEAASGDESSAKGEESQARATVESGFEVHLGSQRPGVEPGTFNGVPAGQAAGAQVHPEPAEIAEGGWNELELGVRGDEYTVRLNGKQTARLTNVDGSRGRRAADDPEAGSVGLSLRGGQMWVRRIELEPELEGRS